jgi:hypothetical protein
MSFDEVTCASLLLAIPVKERPDYERQESYVATPHSVHSSCQ